MRMRRPFEVQIEEDGSEVGIARFATKPEAESLAQTLRAVLRDATKASRGPGRSTADVNSLKVQELMGADNG